MTSDARRAFLASARVAAPQSASMSFGNWLLVLLVAAIVAGLVAVGVMLIAMQKSPGLTGPMVKPAPPGMLPPIEPGPTRPIEPDPATRAQGTTEYLILLVRTPGHDEFEVGKQLDVLRSLGPDACRMAADRLIIAAGEDLDGARNTPVVPVGQLRALKEQLEAARAKLLQHIRAPDVDLREGPGLATTDELVAALRNIWSNPADQAIGDAVHARCRAAQALCQLAAALDADQMRDERERTFAGSARLAHDEARVTVRTLATSAAERELIAEHDEVALDNASDRTATAATAAERDFAAALNELRRMVGLRAVRLNPKLTTAARRNSDYMKQSGTFAHFNEGHPDGTTPGDRAKKQGYQSLLTESIAMNSRGHTADSVLNAWLHSAHVRVLLHPRCVVIGVGSAGTHWTLMAGTATDGSEPRHE